MRTRFCVAVSFVFLFARIKDLHFEARHYGEFLATALSPRPSLANVGRLLFIRQRVRRLPLRAAQVLRESSLQWLRALDMGPEAPTPPATEPPKPVPRSTTPSSK